MQCVVDEELVGWSHLEGKGQQLNIQMEAGYSWWLMLQMLLFSVLSNEAMSIASVSPHSPPHLPQRPCKTGTILCNVYSDKDECSPISEVLPGFSHSTTYIQTSLVNNERWVIAMDGWLLKGAEGLMC